MIIKTLSDAVAIIEFIRKQQGKTIEEAMREAEVPSHLREQILKYFAPPLIITSPDIVVDNIKQIPKCNPENDSSGVYFGAYQNFLINDRGRSKSEVGTIAEISLDLVRRLPRPDAAESFRVRGLVVGHIQSGKTTNMSALIARAADEGYKLFIVLGGLWKELRSQTQRRLDQEITGYSDNTNDEPFIEQVGIHRWVRLTTSGMDGDFFKGSYNDINPETLKLAVIKKNQHIEKLRKWLEESPVPLKDLPVIIIDDEADHGSIDTNYSKVDEDGERINPTITNRRIRELIRALPKCVYIGFTATPFANVLIDAKEDDDLYPADFIASLPEPPGYFGPRKLFGLGMEPSDLSPMKAEKPSLDVIRDVEDGDFDDIGRTLESNGSCPKVLSKALLSFVLSSCGRLARGHNNENDHFSMLVHPSHRTGTHSIMADAVAKELELLAGAAIRPAKFPDILKRAQELWDSDFSKTTAKLEDSELPVQDFDTIWKFAKAVTESIEIKILNSGSDHILEYTHPRKRYIVIGGNKLSRGLTLEGLSISVFTRPTKKYQYDTLLQMGRWFGYRKHYYDLTRIYVDRPLAEKFAELARVEDELRSFIHKYAQEPNPPTPRELTPMIRVHPAMAITSAMKMGAGKPYNFSFQNTTQETVTFPVKNKPLLKQNIQAGKALISELSKSRKGLVNKGAHIWKDVPVEAVIDFLQNYEFSQKAREVSRQYLINYIRRQNDRNELVNWDIILPSGNSKLEPFTWANDVFTYRINRSPETELSIRVLRDPNDIDEWRKYLKRDPKDASQGCLMLYLIDSKTTGKDGMTFFLDESRAEDILGLVFVFPESKSNETIEYVSQQ